MPTPRKRNPLSKLSGLTAEQASAVFDFGEAHTLEVTCKHLADEYDVDISKDGLSRWLNHERAERNFAQQLDRITMADERAGSIAKRVGKATALTEANIALLSTALLNASLAEDVAGVDAASKALSLVVGAATSQQKVTIAADAVALNRDKFKTSLQTKIDAGIDAIFDEVKGNKEGEALVRRLRELVKKEVAAAV